MPTIFAAFVIASAIYWAANRIADAIDGIVVGDDEEEEENEPWMGPG